MSATNERQDPLITEKLEKDVIALRGSIRYAETVLQLKDNEGWKLVRADMEERLGAIEAELDNFADMTDNQIRLKLKERKDFRLLSTLVEKVELRLPQLQSELGKTQQMVIDRKRKVGTPAQT